MTRRRRFSYLLAALVVVASVGLLATGAAATPANETATAGNETDTGPRPANYTLDELNFGGPQIANAAPSRRWFGESGSAYISYAETNFIKKLGSSDSSWSVDHVLKPGETVDTNSVRMHVSRGQESAQTTERVHIVYWEKQPYQVTRGNTTVTKYRAANVTEEVQEVTLASSFEQVDLRLRNHPDRPRRVTMWVEGKPDARWIFKHHSVATASTLPFGSTFSSFLPWFITQFLLITSIGVPLAIGGGVSLVNRVGQGPGKGAAWWLIIGGLATYFGLYAAYGGIASILVAAPYSMALAVVALAFVATLEHVDQTKEVLFERVVSTSVENPLGENVPDVSYEEGKTYHVVELDDGRRGIVKKGSLQHFAVLLLGAEPPALETSELQTRVEYDGAFDEKFYAAEDSDDILSIQWPYVDVSLSNLVSSPSTSTSPDPLAASDDQDDQDEPDVEYDSDKIATALVAGVGGTLVGALITGSYLSGALVGLFPFLYVVAETVDGSATFEPAPAHSTTAKAARVAEQQEYTLGETFEELTTKFTNEQTEQLAEIKALFEARGVGLSKGVTELFGMSDDDLQVDLDESDERGSLDLEGAADD